MDVKRTELLSGVGEGGVISGRERHSIYHKRGYETFVLNRLNTLDDLKSSSVFNQREERMWGEIGAMFVTEYGMGSTMDAL